MIDQTLATAVKVAANKRGKPWRAANKLQVYQAVRRLFDLAIKPGRLRKDNPVSIDLRPRKDAAKLYTFLYPQEFVQLISCTKIPLARHVYYMLGTYTGLRKSSLNRCTWFGFDFANNTIMSLVNKNKVPQIFAQADPALPGLASAMWCWNDGTLTSDAQRQTPQWCLTSDARSAKRPRRCAKIFGSQA